MTHIETIIRDAYDGGYESTPTSERPANWCIFLEPNFWQAVGRQRGWEEGMYIFTGPAYKDYMLMFASHVMDGLDYETALSKIV